MSKDGGGTQRQVTEPWGAAQPFLQDVLGQAQSLYRGGGPAYYPGQSFVGPTPGQIGGWEQQLGYADQVFGGQQAPRFGEATGALSGALTGGSPIGSIAGGYSPAAGTALAGMLSGAPDYSGLQGAIDAANAPILRQFEQDILPGLNQRATFLGNPTGGIKTLNRVLPEIGERMSQNAASLYEGERQRALGAQQAGLGLYGNFAQAAQDATLRGLSLFPGIAQTGAIPGQLAASMGDWGANFQNQALQDQINRYNFYQNAPLQNLQDYSALVHGYGGLGGSTTSPRQGGGATGAIGGAAALGGMGAALGASGPVGWGLAGLGGLLGLLG